MNKLNSLIRVALVATGIAAFAADAQAEKATNVKYIDAEGQERTCAEAEVVAASDSSASWSAGWYVVTNEVTMNGGAYCSGEVHLILADTGSLTISGVADDAVGIAVSGGANSLAIYGQAAGTGVLTVTGGGHSAGIGGGGGDAGSNITINGGTVMATSGNDGGAGIGGGNMGVGSNIKIVGGRVTAKACAFGNSGIGNGAGGKPAASGIYAADDVIVKAGDSAETATEIAHTGTQDIAGFLNEKRYVTAEAPITVAVVVPEVAGATAKLFAFNVNGGWKAVAPNKVPSNATVRVVWTAEDGKGLTGEGAASAFQWQADLVADKAKQTAPAPTVGAAGASAVKIGLDTRAKKSYYEAKEILPVWYAKGGQVAVQGKGQQSTETLVESAAADDTVRWTPAAPDTYTLAHSGIDDNATIIYTLPVEVTTNGLELANTSFAVTDEAGKPLAPVAAYDGKLIVPSNSTVTVTYTVTTPGLYFADGTSAYSATFKAEKSVNVAATEIAEKKPAEPKAPSVQLGTVAQCYPWNGMLEVEYKAMNVPAKKYHVKVTVEIGGVKKDLLMSSKYVESGVVAKPNFNVKISFGEVKGEAEVTIELVEEKLN